MRYPGRQNQAFTGFCVRERSRNRAIVLSDVKNRTAQMSVTLISFAFEANGCALSSVNLGVSTEDVLTDLETADPSIRSRSGGLIPWLSPFVSLDW